MTLIWFILVLGITVFIHELGHFIFAKKAGIYVYEFAIGMGPRIFKFKRKNDETTYAEIEKDIKNMQLDSDIKLELNAEYRAHLFSFLNLAIFADAGNIWLVNEDETRPGGKFSKNFMSEIAVGAGIGLRLDFSIMVLRLDVATPLRVSYYDKGDRWAFDEIDFSDKTWRKDNLIFNIAIGYPF